jgi:hypothetical protein
MASSKRHAKLVNLGKAGSVGLLFEVTDEMDYQNVQKYIQQLQDMKIKVKAMGYVREKHLSTHFLPVLSFDFIYARDLNWFHKPKTKRPADFWQSEFDICINASSPECFPLKYIMTRSSSHLKVGPYTAQDKDYYDVMIQPDVPHDQGRFLQQVHQYLTILNPKENA